MSLLWIELIQVSLMVDRKVVDFPLISSSNKNFFVLLSLLLAQKQTSGMVTHDQVAMGTLYINLNNTMTFQCPLSQKLMSAIKCFTEVLQRKSH